MQTVVDSPLEARPDPDPHAYLARLNPEQRCAVEHGGVGEPAGPLLVIAGAGSGKTNVLAHRVAHLVAEGADPGRILLLTFSRRAAEEMSRRVERIVRQVAVGRPQLAGAKHAWAGTFHASARAFCATTRRASASTRPSPSTTARIPPTC